MSVDVITLLTTDHREVDGLLADLLAGKVTGDRPSPSHQHHRP